MNTIVFNNDATFELEAFNKNTTISGSTLTSTGNATIYTSNIDDIMALALETITSIQILFDEDVIYNSTNLTCKLNSISEYLSGNRVNIQLSFNFE